MSVSMVKRWCAPVSYFSDIQVWVETEKIVVEQGPSTLYFNKVEAEDVIEAIRLAMEVCPKPSDEVPF